MYGSGLYLRSPKAIMSQISGLIRRDCVSGTQTIGGSVGGEGGRGIGRQKTFRTKVLKPIVIVWRLLEHFRFWVLKKDNCSS